MEPSSASESLFHVHTPGNKLTIAESKPPVYDAHLLADRQRFYCLEASIASGCQSICLRLKRGREGGDCEREK